MSKYTIGDVADVKFINKITGEVVTEISNIKLSIGSLYDDQKNKNLLERNVSIETDANIGELLKDSSE